MSATLNSYRAPQGSIIPTVQCRRFSSPSVIWDGVPTGVAGQQDVVSTFRYYAPIVSQVGELRNAPPGDSTPPEDSPPEDLTPPDHNNDDEIVPPEEELLPNIKLLERPKRLGRNIVVKARCLEADNSSPAVGEKLKLGFLQNSKLKVLSRATCNASGVASFKLIKKHYQKGLILTYQNHAEVTVKIPFNKRL